MPEESVKTIWIVTDETPQISISSDAREGTQDTGGFIGKLKQPEVFFEKRFAVSVEKLKQEMTVFMQVIGELFSQAEQPLKGIQLDEIQLSVEINGEGQVSLLGTGTKAGGKGAISLKFKRADSK